MSNRKSIYYWKCDRPSAFGTLNTRYISQDEVERIVQELTHILRNYFTHTNFKILPGGGQGNHLTFRVESDSGLLFIKVEYGPEGDQYMDVEAHILEQVRAAGVPTPISYAVDASRKEVPFSYQVLEYFDASDLNRIHKEGNLDLNRIAVEIGKNIARWQSVQPEGFGPFDRDHLLRTGRLKGFHNTYPDYYHLNLRKHLDFLNRHNVLSDEETDQIQLVVSQYHDLLRLEKGCLVHKDLALWNIIGTPDKIEAFIDWDDTVSGDPTDDLSLLACFHSEDILDAAIKGYTLVRPLPDDFYPRFWLHLLRNMLVKAVIRVGGGYFDRQDDFFLFDSGSDGQSLKGQTRRRINAALEGLRSNKNALQL